MLNDTLKRLLIKPHAQKITTLELISRLWRAPLRVLGLPLYFLTGCLTLSLTVVSGNALNFLTVRRTTAR
jgi:hypothetical protein